MGKVLAVDCWRVKILVMASGLRTVSGLVGKQVAEMALGMEWPQAADWEGV